MKKEKNAQEKLPEFFREYFWDIKFEELDMIKSEFFIIKRVLDRGNTSAIKWLLKTYGKEKFKKVLFETRDLSRPTGNFWAVMLDLDKSKVRCLQKPYSPIHFGLYS